MYVIVIFVYNIFLFAGTIFYSARVGVVGALLVLYCLTDLNTFQQYTCFLHLYSDVVVITVNPLFLHCFKQSATKVPCWWFCRMDLLCRENSRLVHITAHINNKITPAGDGVTGQNLSSCISRRWRCSYTQPTVPRQCNAVLWQEIGSIETRLLRWHLQHSRRWLCHHNWSVYYSDFPRITFENLLPTVSFLFNFMVGPDHCWPAWKSFCNVMLCRTVCFDLHYIIEGLRERTEHLDIFLFFSPSLNGVLFPMFCLLVEWECQILVF